SSPFPSPAISPSANSTAAYARVPVKSSPSPSPCAINCPPSPPHASPATAPANTHRQSLPPPSKAQSTSSTKDAILYRVTVALTCRTIVFVIHSYMISLDKNK
ncbi:transmembrane protein, putative, partial [Medicago truncatula]